MSLSLLYQGTSKCRKVWPYNGEPEDVARTIVTVWTKSGNFSFLASDLEKGPILAPEYGFFVRAVRFQRRRRNPRTIRRRRSNWLSGGHGKGVHRGIGGQEPDHHPSTDPPTSRADVGGGRRRDVSGQDPAGDPEAGV